MSQSGMVIGTGGGGSVPTNVAINYVTDTGTAIAAANILNVIGGEGIDTSGSGNNLTISGEDATAAATAGAANKGISSYDSSMFIVTNGFVQLMSSPTGLSSIIVDANTPPGTNPVVPSGGGAITITGAQVAAGVVGTNVIRSDSIAANSIRIEIQRSTTAAASTVASNGVSHYNSAQFTVDASGFVSAAGGGIATTITGDSGGALSPTANNWNILGSGSITTSGAVSTLTVQLTNLTNHNVLIGAGTSTITKVAPSATSGIPLISQGAAADPIFGTVAVAGGGTGAVTLTGVLTGNGTSPITASPVTQFGVLVGGLSNLVSSTAVGSTGQVLQGNTGAAPTYSTATYPSTTTVSQILYSSATNVVSGLATANRAVLTTSATGVPVLTALATDGQLIIGSTAGAPAAATLTAGAGVTITNASNSITITASGIVPVQFTGDSGTAAPSGGNINIFGLSGSKVSATGATVTIKSPPFSQVGSTATSSLNSGEFVTAAVTRTLPVSAGLADGDLFIYVCTTAAALVIQSVGSQKIRIGNIVSAAAGSITSQAIGDSIQLRFNATDQIFYSVGGPQGTWIIT